MQPKKFRILSAITAGSLALAVAAITASSGTSHTATHAALAAQTESFPPVDLDKCPTLWTGYPTGPCVAQLQTDLHIVQDPNLVVDGSFGPVRSQTWNAVTAFQAAHGLDPDGMVGPATKNALKAVLAGSVPTPVPEPLPPTQAPAPAPAAAGCSDGSRAEAAQYAKANQFSEVLTETWTHSRTAVIGNGESVVLDLPVKVVLRYNSGTSCGWALLDISNVRASTDRLNDPDPWIDAPKAWIDRTSDGGATWTKLGERPVGSGNASTYTGVYNRGPGQMLRACAETDTVPHCTGWY